MSFLAGKADTVRIKNTWGKGLRVIGFLSLLMFLCGGWETWANAPVNLDDPETVICMIVKANAEIDYNREAQTANRPVKKPWLLRDTGVLNRREGTWILVNWHESIREPVKPLAVKQETTPTEVRGSLVEIDLTGEWEIQEEDKAYQATLDVKGNGPYTWQEGRIQTEKVADRLWSGTWYQKGNDREGGFEVLLSEDGKTADGVWWYLRVGTQKNIPPREWGGSYKIKRLSP